MSHRQEIFCRRCGEDLSGTIEGPPDDRTAGAYSLTCPNCHTNLMYLVAGATDIRGADIDPVKLREIAKFGYDQIETGQQDPNPTEN